MAPLLFRKSHSSPSLHPTEPTAALKLVNHSHASLEGVTTVTQPYLLGSLWLQITTKKHVSLKASNKAIYYLKLPDSPEVRLIQKFKDIFRCQQGTLSLECPIS